MKKDIEIKYDIELNRRLKELPDFATDFILSLEDSTSIRTRIAYCKDLSIYLRFILNEVIINPTKDIVGLSVDDIRDIEEKDIRNFLSYLNDYTVEYVSTGGNMVKQSYSNSQQGKNRKIATLRTLYSYLLRHYGLTDPTKYINIKINEKVEIKNSLDGKEIDELVKIILSDLSGVSERQKLFHKKLKYRNANIILLLSYTGIRVSELVSLDIPDIDIDAGTFVITRKGGDQEIAYLPEEIIFHLRDYLEQRKSILDVNLPYRNALFLSNRKSRLSERQINTMLDKYASIVGLTKVTPHTLRRSFGMALYNQTGDIQLTADSLGHSTTETTRRYYAKPNEERKKKILGKFAYSQE
ncbi:tyrosine-type recombinase/integrase [Tissierella carlieri]|uniref:Tyrosine-type recombinase/integrase n=1 Tax=Tissierella carlieri TaxID=689904 RepID=A0ABT1SF64_9FIRM|nr:tyrosine-type recombinase/integrase [Tissierella carlieri]